MLSNLKTSRDVTISRIPGVVALSLQHSIQTRFETNRGVHVRFPFVPIGSS